MTLKAMLSCLGFKVVKFLGEGSYGKVSLASSKRYPNHVAIKIMDRNQMPPQVASKFLPRELEIIRQLSHPHIVQVHEVHETRKGLVFIVMEPALMDLRQMVMELNFIPVDLAKSLFSQIVSAMVYLHEQDIVHRDLKCENVLLTEDGTVKLTDFGFGCKSRGFPQLCCTSCGTPTYCAPEVLKGKFYDAKKSDVWSLGVILYTMVTGELPFNYDNILYLQLQPLKYSIPVEESCRNFISYMLQYNPFTRPSVIEVAQHSWLQSSNLCSSQTTASTSDGESSRASSSLQDINSVQSEETHWPPSTAVRPTSRVINPVQATQEDSWSSGSTMKSISRIVNPVQATQEDSWSSGSTMKSISRIVNPVQATQEDSWSSDSTMKSISRIVNPVQAAQEDSWSSGSTMKSISRIVNPVQAAQEDSWSSGSTMRSVHNVETFKTVIHLKAKAMVNAGALVDLEAEAKEEAKAVVEPVSQLEAVVKVGANLTCPGVEEVGVKEKKFGCFSPLSTRVKRAANACAKAVAPVIRASQSLRGRIKKFFRRTSKVHMSFKPS